MTPLAQKLLIKPGSKWLFLDAPTEAIELAQPLPSNSIIITAAETGVNGVLLFAKSKAELAVSLKTVIPLLTPNTIFWIAYPKRNSKIPSDLKMGDWPELAQHQLCGVASMSINQTWAASRFRPIGQSKISGTGNADIPHNEYAAYIDVATKQLTLPADMAAALLAEPEAMNWFNTLSYSNRKEYLLWILTAKQEKTRLDRLSKIIEKLKAKKKSPAEK